MISEQAIPYAGPDAHHRVDNDPPLQQCGKLFSDLGAKICGTHFVVVTLLHF